MKSRFKFFGLFSLMMLCVLFFGGILYSYSVWFSGPMTLRFGEQRKFNLPELRQGRYQVWVRGSNPELCVIFGGGETRAQKPGMYVPGGYRQVGAQAMAGGSGNFWVGAEHKISGGSVTVCYGCCRKTVFGQKYPNASVEAGVDSN